jgi:putative FmdB family regulatory protein
MPIYEYRCAACGRRYDALQKVSDTTLTECPHCGAAALNKALTAAGFQLKGSGWYATDFKNGQSSPKSDKVEDKPADKAADAQACPGDAAPCAAAACAATSGTSAADAA